MWLGLGITGGRGITPYGYFFHGQNSAARIFCTNPKTTRWNSRTSKAHGFWGTKAQQILGYRSPEDTHSTTKRSGIIYELIIAKALEAANILEGHT